MVENGCKITISSGGIIIPGLILSMGRGDPKQLIGRNRGCWCVLNRIKKGVPEKEHLE